MLTKRLLPFLFVAYFFDPSAVLAMDEGGGGEEGQQGAGDMAQPGDDGHDEGDAANHVGDTTDYQNDKGDYNGNTAASHNETGGDHHDNHMDDKNGSHHGDHTYDDKGDYHDQNTTGYDRGDYHDNHSNWDHNGANWSHDDEHGNSGNHGNNTWHRGNDTGHHDNTSGGNKTEHHDDHSEHHDDKGEHGDQHDWNKSGGHKDQDDWQTQGNDEWSDSNETNLPEGFCKCSGYDSHASKPDCYKNIHWDQVDSPDGVRVQGSMPCNLVDDCCYAIDEDPNKNSCPAETPLCPGDSRLMEEACLEWDPVSDQCNRKCWDAAKDLRIFGSEDSCDQVREKSYHCCARCPKLEEGFCRDGMVLDGDHCASHDENGKCETDCAEVEAYHKSHESSTPCEHIVEHYRHQGCCVVDPKHEGVVSGTIEVEFAGELRADQDPHETLRKVVADGLARFLEVSRRQVELTHFDLKDSSRAYERRLSQDIWVKAGFKVSVFDDRVEDVMYLLTAGKSHIGHMMSDAASQMQLKLKATNVDCFDVEAENKKPQGKCTRVRESTVHRLHDRGLQPVNCPPHLMP